MTEHDPDDRELSPEHEEHVRRLLADARHTEPTPDTVVARLDRVLADLSSEPVRTATVVRLADRRRRAATMLVAAAASVVAVIGVGQILSNTSGGDAASPSSEAAGDAEAPAAQAERGNLQPNGVAGYAARKRMPFELQSDQFARDADLLQLEALASVPTSESNDIDRPSFAGTLLDRVQNRAVCEPGAWGRGSYVAVLYDRAEGWVVLRRPQGDTQIADLFLCGSESVVRSVTLPYP